MKIIIRLSLKFLLLGAFLLQAPVASAYYDCPKEMRSIEKSRLQREYRKFHFSRIENVPVVIQKKSIGFYNQQTVKILMQGMGEVMRPGPFRNEFARVYGGVPSLDDFIGFYENRVDLFSHRLVDFETALANTNWKMSTQVRAYAENRLSGYRSAIEKFRLEQNISGFNSRARALSDGMESTYFELMVLVSNADVEYFNQKVADIPFLKKRVDEKFVQLKAQLRKKPGLINRLKKDFPYVVTTHESSAPHRTPEEFLNSVHDWILKKEADLFCNHGNRKEWIEVKMNHEKFSWQDILSTKGRNASRLTQLSQYREIVDLLDLENQVDVSVLTSGGVSATTLDNFERMRIHVIEPDSLHP